jgi:hypothetical protein
LCAILCLLLGAASGQARTNRRALLLGTAGESAVQKVENELRAAGYETEVVVESAAATEAELSDLARQRDAQAVIRIDGAAAAREVVVFIVGSAGREFTLRRLTPRPKLGEDADGVLALRVVEIVNAAMQELYRETRRVPRKVNQAPPATPSAPIPPRTRFSLGAGARALWFPGALPPLVGPELSGRVRAPWGLFGEATGFVSASKASFVEESGTATFRAFSAGLKLGYGRVLSRRLAWATGIGAAGLLSWADATPAAGYQARQALARAAVLHATGEFSIRLSPWLRLSAALDGGAVLPRLELGMAGEPIADARWLGAASLGLAMEWEP